MVYNKKLEGDLTGTKNNLNYSEIILERLLESCNINTKDSAANTMLDKNRKYWLDKRCPSGILIGTLFMRVLRLLKDM